MRVGPFIFARRHSYGTILVDRERDAVVDLLPDRQAETLAAWLRRHPDEEVARLRAEGLSLRRIAARLGIEHKTVRRWLRLGHAPRWQKPPRGSILAPYADFLDQRWAEGCRNAAQLWRELVARGFSGRPSIVRAWAGRRRKSEPAGAAPVVPAKPAWHPPIGRRLGRMLMADAEALSEPDRLFAAQLFSAAPKLAEAITLARRLHQVLRRESKESLHDVLAAARNTLLAGFAAGLRQDCQSAGKRDPGSACKKDPCRRWNRVVQVANRRDPRATRSALTSDAAARAGGACLPTWATLGWGVRGAG